MSRKFCQKYLSEIQEDLENYRGYWVVLFGSCLNGEDTIRSDIDIAIISKLHDKKENEDFLFQITGQCKDIYDVKILELLPLYIQGEILENYMVIFGDEIEISYYLYKFTKMWEKL